MVESSREPAEKSRPVVTTAECRALLFEVWILAVAVCGGTSVGLVRLGKLPGAVAVPVGFLIGTLVAYPAARVWCRTHGQEVSFSRYLSIWFGVSVFMMIGMGLTS